MARRAAPLARGLFTTRRGRAADHSRKGIGRLRGTAPQRARVGRRSRRTPAAILESPDGLDLAEFSWYDPESDDGCYRAWDYQWSWYTCSDTYQVDQGGRATGKTVGITMRAFALPFAHPGAAMLLTAPELNHLRPLVDAIEERLLGTRLTREMLPAGKGNGMNRQPHWQVRFLNNTKIVSRLPNKDGKGVKPRDATRPAFTFLWTEGEPASMALPSALVLTRRGNLPITDVAVGDEVLTHRGRWRRVLATHAAADAPVVEIAGGGNRALQVSETHAMWARRNRNPQRTVRLEPPNWTVPAGAASGDFKEFTQRWYLASPRQIDPVSIPWMPHPDRAALMRLAGAYVADGYAIAPSGVVRSLGFSDATGEAPRLQGLLAALGIGSGCHAHGTGAVVVYGYKRDATPAAQFLVEHFGRLAAGKRIPVWLLGADEDLRRAFLEPYLAGDGSWSEAKGRYTASTASKELAVGLRLLGQSLGYTCGLSWVDPKVTQIAGRPLRAPAQRSFRVTFTVSGRNAVVEGGLAWQKVRAVISAGHAPAYDLAVEQDHSYVADALVHAAVGTNN